MSKPNPKDLIKIKLEVEATRGDVVDLTGGSETEDESDKKCSSRKKARTFHTEVICSDPSVPSSPEPYRPAAAAVVKPEPKDVYDPECEVVETVEKTEERLDEEAEEYLTKLENRLHLEQLHLRAERSRNARNDHDKWLKKKELTIECFLRCKYLKMRL